MESSSLTDESQAEVAEMKMDTCNTDKEDPKLFKDKTFQAKNKGIFGNYFDYLGHLSGTDKLKAICTACKVSKKSAQPHNFDNHNFKANAKRHYKKVHQAIEWKELADHHKIRDFYSPASAQSQLTEKDPLQQKINACYLDLICVDGLPMNLTTGLGFQHFMYELNQRIRPTDRRTLTRILHKKVDQMARPIIASELKTLDNESLHLSTDIWTSRKGDGIIALRGQFITEQENNFKVVAHTLGLKEFNDRHTSENIREEVTKILRLYDGALPKVGFIVTDGAQNMIAAFRNHQFASQTNNDNEEENPTDIEELIPSDATIADNLNEDDDAEGELDIDTEIRQFDHIFAAVAQAFGQFKGEEKRISCFVHSLQLVINDALKMDSAVRMVMADVKKIVKFFNKATYWKNKLREKVTKDLIQPAPTRWSSYYDTLSRITEDDMYKATLETIILAKSSPHATSAIRDLANLPAKSMLLELTNLLSHIAAATDNLQGNGVTSSIILYQIASCFDEICRCPTMHYPKFKLELLKSLQKRFQEKIQEKLVILSAVLDPRQKMSIFEMKVSNYEGISLSLPDRKSAERYLREEMLKFKPLTNDLQSNQQEKKTNMFAKLGSSSGNRDSGKMGEIEKYLITDREDVDPLQFWFTNKTTLSQLTILARQYLAIPASTGDVERLFSTAGSFARARRSRLMPSTMENMIMYRESRLPVLKRWKENSSSKRKIHGPSLTESLSKQSKTDELSKESNGKLVNENEGKH